jgi:hypothetical protein
MNIDEQIRQNVEERQRIHNQRQKIFGAQKLEPGVNPKVHSEKDMINDQLLSEIEKSLLVKHKFLLVEKHPGYMIDEEALNEELNKRQMKIDELEDLLKTRS